MMGGGGGGSILLLVVLALLVWAIIKFVPDWRERLGLNSSRADDRPEDSAEKILQQHFTRGEIVAEDYERSLEVVRKGRVSEKSGAKEV